LLSLFSIQFGILLIGKRAAKHLHQK